MVGSPAGPSRGQAGAKGFYDQLTSDLDIEEMDLKSAQYGEDFCVAEHEATCVVNGSFLGVPGNGRRVTFRMLHVFDFTEEKISREQIWLDGGSIVAQLTA